MIDQNSREIYLLKVLSELSPESGSFIIRGEQIYENIEWSSSIQTKPSKEEVEKKIEELMLEEPMKRLRIHRDILLQKSDWVVLSDVTLSEKKKNAWLEYRQALRNLPNTANPEIDGPFIKNVDWPTPPS